MWSRKQTTLAITSQPYQEVGYDTVASAALHIGCHDIFLDQIRSRDIIGGTAKEVLNGVFDYRSIGLLR